MPPVWLEDILMFNVIKTIKNCIIEVFDEGNLVGECIFKLQDMLKQEKQKQYDEDILYQGVLAGTIRFQTFKG